MKVDLVDIILLAVVTTLLAVLLCGCEKQMSVSVPDADAIRWSNTLVQVETVLRVQLWIVADTKGISFAGDGKHEYQLKGVYFEWTNAEGSYIYERGDQSARRTNAH